MKIKRMTDFAAVTLAVVMCLGCIAAHAAPTTPTEAEPVSEPAFMERVTASDLPFEFAVTAYDDNTVTVSYGRTARSVVTNEKMFVTDSETGISAEKFDGTFDLSYNKVYKFSYMYESSGMKYYYDGEVSFPDSDGTPQPVFSNIVLNSFSSGSEIPRSAGVIYEIESNDTYATATTTYDDYDNYGTISSPADVDWWKITFNTPGTANFWLGEIPYGCDYDLFVYDSTGTHLVGGSVSSGNSSELVSGLNVAAGTYYVQVLWGDDGISTDYYKLRIKWYPIYYTWTFQVRDASTLNYISGTSTVEIRGHRDNYEETIYNGQGTVSVIYGREVGVNVRSNGYLTYAATDTEVVTGNKTISVLLTSAQGLAQSTGFTAPFDTYYILSPFGWRSWPPDNGYYANFDNHSGVDMPKSSGTVIKSICDVSPLEFNCGFDTYMGNYVRVEDEESSYIIRYMHMYEQFGTTHVTSVNQGDCIGYVGNTGNSGGAHLHIDIGYQEDDYSEIEYYDPIYFWTP